MNYKMKRLPANIDDFSSELLEYRQSARGAVAGCIAALNIMAGNPEEGRKAMMLLNPETPESTLRLAENQLSASPWLMGSYFQGTTPENNYMIPEELVIHMTTNPYSGSSEDGSIKFFVACSGADSPRPVTVENRENGSWYAREWSSLIVGIRKPQNL